MTPVIVNAFSTTRHALTGHKIREEASLVEPCAVNVNGDGGPSMIRKVARVNFPGSGMVAIMALEHRRCMQKQTLS